MAVTSYKNINSSTIGTDLGSNALFRSYVPTASPDRTFPKLSDVLNNTVNTKGETLPVKSRTLHFRLTAVDGKGGSNNDNMQVIVDSRSGPFKVRQPNTAVTLNSTQPQVIEWNAARTDLVPVNCPHVDILYSSDGGTSFNSVLTSTPNDGAETVYLPAGNTSQARIEIKCSDNIFYDISDTNFTVSDVSGDSLTSTATSSNNGGGSMGILTLIFAILISVLRIGKNHTFNNLVIDLPGHHIYRTLVSYA